MNPEEQYENASVVLSRVRQVIQKNRASDLFHKAFLRPQEIAMKTWRTQNRQDMDSDSLAFGLKQAVKKDISLNQYVLQDFNSFEDLSPQHRNIQYVRQNNYDNLISLLKPREINGRIQICICICMYSEDKGMLRKTLAGVSNNIATFVQNGLSPDEIIVAVIMDGIQKVDPSVVDLFGELEKESNIYLDDQIQRMEPKQMLKDDYNEVDDEEVININGFIFDEFQLEDRKKRRFAERKREYEEVLKMKKKIQVYELDKKITYEDLDQFLKPFFLSKAQQYYKKQHPEEKLQLDERSQEKILKEFANNVKKSRPVIYEALSQAKSYCEKYIQTRENLALLNSFRVDVTFGSFDKKQPIAEKSYDKLSQEQRNQPEVKMNLLFITKYKNSGKLSSHNWFFNGLCQQIKTQYAVLLDVGLCPEKTALFKMYNHMKQNTKCGGVCGYMNLRIERLEEEDEEFKKSVGFFTKFCLHFVDIQRAQQVQYHFAHLIDKPFEALFKFIHVLPGAFSAYRMSALHPPQQKDSQLLKQYFKSLQQSTSRKLWKTEFSTGKAIAKVILPDFIFNKCFAPKTQQIQVNGQIRQQKQLTQQQLLYNSNVYLAQDRTLCMGIHQNGYELDYLPDAHAWVDPIKHVHGLLGQRKRWINGSFFAFESVKEVLGEQSRGDWCLKLQIFYLNLMNMLAFVSPALFLFTVHISMFAFRDWFFNGIASLDLKNFKSTQFYNSFVFVLDFVYVMLMLGLIFKSIHFTHRQPKFIPFVYGMSTVMGLFSFAVFFVLIYDLILGIVDTFNCSQMDKTSCITYLANDDELRKQFYNALPGGLTTFIIYKWIVLGVVAMYIIPISVYAIFYCKFQFMTDVIFGVFSFIFYTPTYLNILNTFALCRIDDISWGTKGLDAEDNKNKNLKDSWKSIKMLHVAKFLFWNIVVAAAMLMVSSPINFWYGSVTEQNQPILKLESYVRKFFMTFALMIVIGFTLFLKIFLGAMYSIGYRCTHLGIKKKVEDSEINSAIIKENKKTKIFFNEVKRSMDEQLREYIHGMVNNVNKNKNIKGYHIKNLNSLIMVHKSFIGADEKKKQKQKWNKLMTNQSKIVKKDNKSASRLRSVIRPSNSVPDPVPINLNDNDQYKGESATMLKEKDMVESEAPVFNVYANSQFQTFNPPSSNKVKQQSSNKLKQSSKLKQQQRQQEQQRPKQQPKQQDSMNPQMQKSFLALQQPSSNSIASQSLSSQYNVSGRTFLDPEQIPNSKQSQPDVNKPKKSKNTRKQVMKSFMNSTNSFKKEIQEKDKNVEKKEEKKYFGLF